MASPDLPPIRPVSQSLSVQWMNYGAPGVGKTSLIGTGGKGHLIIRPAHDHTDPILGSGVQEWVVTTWQEMMEDVMEYLQHEGHKWDWIWLDSISSFQDTGLDDIWQQVIDRRPDRKMGPIDKGEYGINMSRLQQWVRHVSGLSTQGLFHFGITAWSETLWHDPSDSDILKPWVQGKQMSDKIMGYMNMVSYMEVRKKHRILRFETTEDYYAKDQFNAFEGHRLVDPTMPKIMEAVDAARAKQAAPVRKKSKTTRRKTGVKSNRRTS